MHPCLCMNPREYEGGGIPSTLPSLLVFFFLFTLFHLFLCFSFFYCLPLPPVYLFFLFPSFFPLLFRLCFCLCFLAPVDFISSLPQLAWEGLVVVVERYIKKGNYVSTQIRLNGQIHLSLYPIKIMFNYSPYMQTKQYQIIQDSEL
jgi:hypothetical protein